MQKLKIVFMGTPIFSIPVLEALIRDYEIVAVVTQPDKPVGRKQIRTISPIKRVALENQLEVFDPAKVGDITETLINLAPDFIISCAYGQIIPPAILSIPKYYALNVHASLLPKYRGAAPIQRAIMHGDTITGVTIMQMEAGLDTGPMFIAETIKLNINDNFKSVHDKLSILGANLLIKVIENIVNHNLNPVPQNNDLATYADKIGKADELIDFNQSTIDVYNHIRALTPMPGVLYNGLSQSFKIYDASYIIGPKYHTPGIISVVDHQLLISTNDGFIDVKTIQIPGKPKMTIKDYLNGLK